MVTPVIEEVGTLSEEQVKLQYKEQIKFEQVASLIFKSLSIVESETFQWMSPHQVYENLHI